jgi:hypothetical protein
MCLHGMDWKTLPFPLCSIHSGTYVMYSVSLALYDTLKNVWTVNKCNSILFYSILFYYILFYSALFYSTLFYSVLLYSNLLCSVQFYSILFYSILFYSTLFYSILLLFHSSAIRVTVAVGPSDWMYRLYQYKVYQ